MSFETHLDDPLLRELYAYWRLKRAARRMPPRRQIDPTEVPRLLPHLVISESVEDGRRFRYRLAGTAIARAIGIDPTGRCVEEVANGSYRDYINELHRAVWRERVPVFAASAFVSAKRGKTYFARRLLLPLSEDDHAVHQLLSMVIFHFAVGRPAITVLDADVADAAD
ncbi:MAG: PAS domain-containing protein [Stellaceae bacterium]